MTARSIKDGPWCWQSKAELSRIVDACDGRTDRALVLSVYLALTWIASDTGSEVFSAPKADIAARAGVSYRKVADVLALLERIGSVTSERNVIPGTKELGPNTYTLGTQCTTSGIQCPRLGTDAEQGSVPRIREKKGKKIEIKGSPSAALESSPDDGPLGWQAWLAERYDAFKPGGEQHGKAWHEIDDALRLLVRREMPKPNAA